VCVSEKEFTVLILGFIFATPCNMFGGDSGSFPGQFYQMLENTLFFYVAVQTNIQ
jgi:hypothetical protein